MTTRNVFFNKFVYWYNPMLERVCKVYNVETKKPMTIFDLLYACLAGTAFKLEKRPHDKDPATKITQLVEDTDVDEAKRLHRQNLATTFLVKKATGEDSHRIDQIDVDDIKTLAGVRYSRDPGNFAQLCQALDGEKNQLEELYFSQPKEYFELDAKKLFDEMNEFFTPKDGRTRGQVETVEMKGFVIDIIQALYAHDPENSLILAYNKKGEDLPLKDEVKKHKKESEDDKPETEGKRTQTKTRETKKA